jgi:hypothetical protein
MLSLPAAAASAQPSKARLSPPPPPPPGGHTYFYCNWLGNWIRVKHAPNVSVERFKDAAVIGMCQDLRTNDHYYNRLIGRNINVFYAPREYPGVFVVHNGRQGRQPVLGTWTFAIPGAPSATLSGTVTDSATSKPIAGATVSAQQCIAKPTQHCTIHTDKTNASGKYAIQFFAFGKWKITATATGYAAGGSVTESVTSGKSSILNIALVRQPVNLTLAVGISPSPATVGSAVTVAVTLSQAVADGLVTVSTTGTATGTFSASTCTPSAGKCSVTWTASTPGTVTFSASWSGDTLYNGATNTATLTVNPLSTTLAVTASPSPATTGQTVTLTATLGTAASGGTVTFTASGPSGAVFPALTCTPAAGTCTATWQASNPGTWNISASWSGAGQYGPATGTASLVVNPSGATMTLTANPAAPQSGQATVLTATLSVPAGDGLITFTGTGPIGSTFTQQSCTPTAGACTVSWTPTTAGTWSLTASWSGDTQYPSGAQAAAQVAVGSGTIAIGVSASPNPAAINNPVTLKATLTQPVSDGSVVFSEVGPNNANMSQTCAPTNGICTAAWTPTTSGQWQVTAFWSGDNQHQPVTSNIQVTVSSSATAVTVSATPNPVRVSHPTQITATLSSSATGGTIVFSGIGPANQLVTTNPTNCVPSNGSCSVLWTPPSNAQGIWTITASWNGNSQFAAGTGSTTVTVSAPGFLTVLETPDPLQVNQTGTITAALQTPGVGQVNFIASGSNGGSYTGQCTLGSDGRCSATDFKPLIAGFWTISALWSGDSNHAQTEQDTTIVQVVGASTTLTLSTSPNPPAVGQPAVIAVSIAPAVSDGTVVFSGSGPSGQSFSPSPSTCQPTGGVCTVNWTPLVTGTWTIFAHWGGDATHAGASQTITVVVGSGQVSISSSPTTPSSGQQVTLTATLPFATTSASTFAWSGTGPNSEDLIPRLSNPSCSVAQGTTECSVTWTPDAGGTWSITATWSGDSTHGSDAATASINVQQAFLTVTTAPPSPIPVHSTAGETATLSDPTVSDGTIIFTVTPPASSGEQPQVTQCSVSGGTCSETWNADVAGTWTISANWSGDSTYPAKSATITVQVQ